MGPRMNTAFKNHTLAFFLQDLAAPGGTEKVITVWANHFSQLGFKVEMVSEPSPTPFFLIDHAVKRSVLDLDAEKSIKQNPFVLLKRIWACKKWLGQKEKHFLIINKSV